MCGGRRGSRGWGPLGGHPLVLGPKGAEGNDRREWWARGRAHTVGPMGSAGEVAAGSYTRGQLAGVMHARGTGAGSMYSRAGTGARRGYTRGRG